MPAVHIVTDTAADLPAEEAAALGIELVPLTIRFGDAEHTDGVDLSVKEFYAKMAESDELPATAAPAPGAFEEAFRRAAADGGSVVCISLSSQLSATMQSAENAARAVAGDIDVRVLDSCAITAAQGNLVLAAAELAAEGASADDVVALVESLRPRTRIYGTLDTLDNLKKGGRVGGAKAFFGTMLSIKPIVDISTGVVEEAGRQRTRKKALVYLRDKLFERPTVERLAVCTGDAPDTQDLIDLISPRYSADQIQIRQIGPVIGTHGGPRVLGLAWLEPA
jgi:fatty acid kinase fatty acid binding subunit